MGVNGLSSNENEFDLPRPTFETFNIFCSVVIELHFQFWFLRNTPTLVSMFFSDQGQDQILVSRTSSRQVVAPLLTRAANVRLVVKSSSFSPPPLDWSVYHVFTLVEKHLRIRFSSATAPHLLRALSCLRRTEKNAASHNKTKPHDRTRAVS